MCFQVVLSNTYPIWIVAALGENRDAIRKRIEQSILKGSLFDVLQADSADARTATTTGTGDAQSVECFIKLRKCALIDDNTSTQL